MAYHNGWYATAAVRALFLRCFGSGIDFVLPSLIRVRRVGEAHQARSCAAASETILTCSDRFFGSPRDNPPSSSGGDDPLCSVVLADNLALICPTKVIGSVLLPIDNFDRGFNFGGWCAKASHLRIYMCGPDRRWSRL